MEQRDYLLRQIELMSQALVTLIRKLLGLKDDMEEIEQATDETLSEYLNLSIEEILHCPQQEIVQMIIEKSGIHESNLELFAEILLLNGKTRNSKEEKLELFEKSLELLNWVDEKSNIYSLQRQQKMLEIRELVANL